MGYRSTLSWIGVVAVSLGLAGCKTPTGPTVAQQYPKQNSTTTVTQTPMNGSMAGNTMPQGSMMQGTPTMANNGMTPASPIPQAWGNPPSRTNAANPPMTSSAPVSTSSYSTTGMTSPSITNSPSVRSTQGYPTPLAPSLGSNAPTSMAGAAPMSSPAAQSASPIRQVSLPDDKAPMMPPATMGSSSPLSGSPQVDAAPIPMTRPAAPPSRINMDNSQANPLTLPPPGGASLPMPKGDPTIHEVSSTPPSRSPVAPSVDVNDNGPSLGGDH